MADYSPHVLAAPSERVADYAGRSRPRARLPQPDARPRRTSAEGALRPHLQPLRQPPDRRDHARRRRRVRAARASSITPGRGRGACRRHRVAREARSSPRPAHHPQRARVLPDPGKAVRFWADVWDAVHLEEIYGRSRRRRRCASPRPPRPTSTSCSPTCPSGRGVHRSTVAVESFAQTLMLLHHEGMWWRRTSSSARLNQYAPVPRSGQARGLDRQLAQRPDLPDRRRPPRLQGRRGAVRVPRGSNTAVLTARHRDTHRVALGTKSTPEDADLAAGSRERRRAAVAPVISCRRPTGFITAAEARHQPRADHRDARPARAGDRP